MKKFVLFLLTALLIIGILPTFTACVESTPSNNEIEISRTINTTEDLSYLLKEDGYWVDVYQGDSKTTIISIPDKYNGKDVVGIVPKAFAKLENLETLSMPSTITKVKNIKDAFKDENGVLFDTIKTLEVCADNAVFLPVAIRTGIENLYLYGETLHEQAFSGAYGLKNLKIAEGLVKIGNYGFEDCYNLKTLVFPASLEVLAPYAFIRVYPTTIVFNKGTKIKEIGEACFNNVGSSLEVLYYGGTKEQFEYFRTSGQIDGYFNDHFCNFIANENNVVFF